MEQAQAPQKESLFRSLVKLKGNARCCVYTEPMWGIPYNLYIPYASLYMSLLGLGDAQIGLIASIGMACQVVVAVLSGIITDKMGRRKATVVFDILSWSVPCLIWAAAQNFWYFLAAIIVNSLWRVTENSWKLLLVEDTPKNQLVPIFTWVSISGLLSAFFAPLSGLLVKSVDVVPAMRILYLVSFALMTAKFLVLFVVGKETRIGQIRMEETRHVSWGAMFREYGGVIRQMLHNPGTLLALGVMVVHTIGSNTFGTFFGLLATDQLGMPNEFLAVYPVFRSLLMLVFFFGVMPRISRMRKPHIALAVGFCCYTASCLLLVGMPAGSVPLMILCALLQGCGEAMVMPLMETMVVVNVDDKERARIMGLMYMVVLLFSSPFGYIAGLMSAANRTLPFILNAGMFLLGCVLALASGRSARPADAA